MSAIIRMYLKNYHELRESILFPKEFVSYKMLGKCMDKNCSWRGWDLENIYKRCPYCENPIKWEVPKRQRAYPLKGDLLSLIDIDVAIKTLKEKKKFVPKEWEVLNLIIQGYNNRDIEEETGIGRNKIRRIFRGISESIAEYLKPDYSIGRIFRMVKFRLRPRAEDLTIEEVVLILRKLDLDEKYRKRFSHIIIDMDEPNLMIELYPKIPGYEKELKRRKKK